MLNFLNESMFFGLFISVGAYFVGWLLNRRFKKDFINPLIIAVLLVAAFLLVTCSRRPRSALPFRSINSWAY